jgi:hypothetical protein
MPAVQISKPVQVVIFMVHFHAIAEDLLKIFL